MRMSFFATEADELDVWRMVFAIPDMHVLEHSSRGEQPLQDFASPEEIFEARATDRPHLLVSAVPFSVGGLPGYEEIIHHDSVARRGGGRWRHVLRGPTLINFNRHSPQRPNSLSACTFTALNPAGARERSMHSDEHLDDVDWKTFASIFRKMQRQIDAMSRAKLGSSRVLPDAFRRLEAGEITLWGWGEEVSISSPNITIKQAKPG
jgi:hypothetical protein